MHAYSRKCGTGARDRRLRSKCAMIRPLEGGGLLIIGWLLALCSIGADAQLDPDYGCPLQERILPCRCSTRDMEVQIWQVQMARCVIPSVELRGQC